ncbi:MAG: hypothetical protein NZ959_04675 [Armatimonadetes bacterium]|nr:hypothetical protein [Armatimonadota bacterium]MDW8121857.1 hypothetical protein [Armatimonadota bacterium]
MKGKTDRLLLILALGIVLPLTASGQEKGRILQEFVLVGLDGKKVRWKEFRGRVVLINLLEPG